MIYTLTLLGLALFVVAVVLLALTAYVAGRPQRWIPPEPERSRIDPHPFPYDWSDHDDPAA